MLSYYSTDRSCHGIYQYTQLNLFRQNSNTIIPT